MPNVQNFTTSQGKPYPFGISPLGKGLNFALTSKHAEAVTLCLFDRESKRPVAEIPLSPQQNKTGYVWHIQVNGLSDNLVYAYRIEPSLNNKQDLLLDPYAKGLATPTTWGQGRTAKNRYAPYGEILAETPFDWGDDTHPHIPLNELVIYEMHVRGFTQHSSSKTGHPGTFLGVVEKIPHLLELGVNAVELMPLQEFNETEYADTHPNAPKGLYNFWGYSTVNYFAPMNRYASSNDRGAAIYEFKTMVKELHRHGIEVILDVVFNHTGEGNQTGPIFSFKGIDNAIYYMLDHQQYRDYTGCGNTFNTNQTTVKELIINSLRYWVVDMHVDGFRFDLATIFCRDSKGTPLPLAPIIKAITEDPILANTKLIAEPWDAVGLYQVGNFACKSPRWLEWNDKYRDCVRRFIKGMSGSNGDFARRLSGSEDLYHERCPCNSINFVTAHDGFTLADLVSYNTKHNLDNGEKNQDGSNHNESWNHGVEGPTDDKKILQLRQQQMRNFHLALMLSQGTPMLLMGDEYGHTKNGNNNTWCHDSELNWFLWDKLAANKDFYRFYAGLIHFRKTHPILQRCAFLTDNDIDWHGTQPFKIEWNTGLVFVAFTLKDHDNHNDLYAAFNAQNHELVVHLPPPPEGKQWHWAVNTASPPPADFFDEGKGPAVEENGLSMPAYSAILLQAL